MLTVDLEKYTNIEFRHSATSTGNMYVEPDSDSAASVVFRNAAGTTDIFTK